MASPTSQRPPRPSATTVGLPWRWSQGEHLALIGETNSGKSTLAAHLLEVRSHLVVMRTKLDKARRALEYPVEIVTKTHRTMENLRYSRIELRPAYDQQAREIHLAYQLAFKHGGWCVYNDEEWYLEEELGLGHDINKLLTQGGGNGVTMAMSAQRPSRISRFVLSQSQHVICFGVEGRDVKIVADATSPRVGAVAAALGRFEVVWYNRATRELWRGRLNIDVEPHRLEGALVSGADLRLLEEA